MLLSLHILIDELPIMPSVLRKRLMLFLEILLHILKIKIHENKNIIDGVNKFAVNKYLLKRIGQRNKLIKIELAF